MPPTRPQSERPVDEQPTRILSGGYMPETKQRPTGKGRWFRSLRFRLIATYALVLAVILLALGIALNIFTARVLYAEELARLEGEAQATVATEQSNFDKLVAGTAANNCDGAVAYQDAFVQTIALHLTASHIGVDKVYLLSRTGTVLAPLTGDIAVGSPGPFITRAHVDQLHAKAVAAARQPITGSIAAISYLTSQKGTHTGVVLVAERFRTASVCFGQPAGTYGIVELTTTFPHVQHILSVLHLILLFSLLAALAAGLLIGGPLTSQALQPLTRMAQVARRIADGDLSQRVRLPHGGDEIGQLTDTFDEMVSRIEQAFGAQAASEERMRQFIADASHELRTPLTSIRGYLDVLLRGAKDDPATADEVLRATRREAERMTRLVNDLLTLARLDAGRPLELQPLDLIALAGEAVDQARILAGEREVTLRTDGAGRLIAPADGDRIKQVLLILLDNALKYGRPGPDGRVQVSVWRTPQFAQVSVSDNGPGIPASDLPHIFDRFYRAQRSAQHRRMSTPPDAPARQGQHAASQRDGTGLGLPIAQAIARAHGGNLAVQSQEGAGTTFTLSLPLPPPPLPPRDAHVP